VARITSGFFSLLSSSFLVVEALEALLFALLAFTCFALREPQCPVVRSTSIASVPNGSFLVAEALEALLFALRAFTCFALRVPQCPMVRSTSIASVPSGYLNI